MAVHLRILLILSGLAGVHSITTVSEVSVKAGGSVSIPCLYESRYRNHVKYLCQGQTWSSCSYAVKTNQQSSGRFSISDDTIQRIFTVTIKDLTVKDTDYYWCNVEIKQAIDDGVQFHLSVTTGTPSLYVDQQEIRAFKGESITIKCNHRNSGEMSWCRLGRFCVTGSSESIDGTRVAIDKKTLNVFTVTMSDLRTESSGWYLCVKGDLQMPVHLTVTEKPTTTTLATTTHLTTISPTPAPVNLTSGFTEVVTTPVQSESTWNDLMILLIPLILLILTVMVTLFIWFLLARHKQSKAAAMAVTPYAESDVDVIYSSVVTRPKSVPKVEANDVTYSTVAFH